MPDLDSACLFKIGSAPFAPTFRQCINAAITFLEPVPGFHDVDETVCQEFVDCLPKGPGTYPESACLVITEREFVGIDERDSLMSWLLFTFGPDTLLQEMEIDQERITGF